MCTFLTSRPKHSKNASQKRNIVLNLKPCKNDENGKKTWYRLRLLAWTAPEKNDRDDIFIERYVHQVWKKDPEKGFMYIDDEVTCPVTKYVKFEGNRYDGCPICRLANQYFMTWKESNWKNKEAAKQNKTIGRKYQGIVPVYVIDDPNYPKNNGTIRALIFASKSPSKKELESGNYNKYHYFDEFCKLVEKAQLTNCCFNGKNAVDCCIHVSEKEKKVNEGKPTEYTFREKYIDKIVFTDTPKDIPNITKELVTESGFDEQYYTTSSLEELQAFYNRHYKISNDDIPDDDASLDVIEDKSEDKPIQKAVQTENPDASNSNVEDVLNNASAIMDTPMPFDESESKNTEDVQLNDVNSAELLKELGIE